MDYSSMKLPYPVLVTSHILTFSKKNDFLAREKRPCSDALLSEYCFCDDWMPQTVIHNLYHKRMTDFFKDHSAILCY